MALAKRTATKRPATKATAAPRTKTTTSRKAPVPQSEQKPPRYVLDMEDGTQRVVYRASSLGMCDKAIVATALGFEPQSKPEWFQEVLDEGTNAEPIIAAKYTEETGNEITDDQKQVKLEIMDGVWIYASIDGLVWDGGSPVLWESKKFRDSTWDGALRKGVEVNKNYPMQVSAMMHALSDEYDTDVELDFTIGHMDTASGEIVEIFIHRLIDPPVNRLAIRKRIAHLEKLVATGDLAGTACPLPLQYPCGFFHFHDDQDTAEGKLDIPSDVTLDLLVQEYEKADEIRKDLERQVKEASAASRNYKEGIQEWLKAQGFDGKEGVVDIDGVKYKLLTKETTRAGYEVKPSTFQQTTIKRMK